MARIGHLIRTFLAPTETFIYAELRNHRRHEPVVLARRRKAADQFPIETAFIAEEGLPLPLVWASRASHRLLRTCLPAAADWLAKEAQKADVKLLHGHFGTDARYFLGVKRRTGLPLVATFYGYDASSFPQKFGGLGAWYLRPLFEEADAIIAISRFMADRLVEFGCPREKIRVIHFGIDLAPFTATVRTLSPGETPTLLHVARMVPKKGHRYLLEAVRRLREKAIPVRLWLVGAGPLEEELRIFANDWGIADSVEFYGLRPHSEIARLMAAAHIYVQPSVTPASGDQEGTPTTLMEAMATGMPVVATRHAGIPELVAEGACGSLVPEKDSGALAEALSAMIAAPGSWGRLGAAGRRKIEAEFSAAREMAKVEDLYDELLGL